MNDGYYVVVTFKSEGNLPAELERLYKIDESILRSMTTKLEFEAVPKAIPAMTETAEDATEETAAPEVVAEEAPATETAE
jgi:small subunit ribosomal protein S6